MGDIPNPRAFLQSVELYNFHGIRGAYEMFPDFTTIHGPSGSGKSSIIAGFAYATGSLTCNSAGNDCFVELKFRVGEEEQTFKRGQRFENDDEYLVDGVRMPREEYLDALRTLGIRYETQKTFIDHENPRIFLYKDDTIMEYFGQQSGYSSFDGPMAALNERLDRDSKEGVLDGSAEDRESIEKQLHELGTQRDHLLNVYYNQVTTVATEFYNEATGQNCELTTARKEDEEGRLIDGYDLVIRRATHSGEKRDYYFYEMGHGDIEVAELAFRLGFTLANGEKLILVDNLGVHLKDYAPRVNEALHRLAAERNIQIIIATKNKVFRHGMVQL